MESPTSAPAAPFVHRAPAAERHLVIVHQPGWQAIEDWVEIRQHIRRIDPSTQVLIVPADRPSDDLAAQAAERPTLIFSSGPLGSFRPLRGKAYFGQSMPKFEQLRRLAMAGVPVPRSQLLAPETRFDPKEWGDIVVVKPTLSSLGHGVQMMRTERVRFIPPEQYPETHGGRHGPMLVQAFVDTGDHVTAFRVLSLFGQPLYCVRYTGGAPRVSLDADDATLEREPVATQAHPVRSRDFIYDADVVALARRVYAAIPEVPLQGCDVVREVSTGRVFVLEINPLGNTWQFSSQLMARARQDVGPSYLHNMKTQLDAFRTTAHTLAEITRREAV